MDGSEAGRSDKPPDFPGRETLCISQPVPNLVLHDGDHGFQEELQRRFKSEESVAIEKLIKLKEALRMNHNEEEFWPMATEGLADLTGGQYAFINKRMVVDDEDVAVEMPPIGQKGSCLMAQALYYNDGKGQQGNPRNVKYNAYGCPCAFMKHDKTFLVPERLNEFILDNPNAANFVVPAEAYLAVPLKDKDGKCFGHFGVMWSAEGLANLKLSWAFVEMIFHSLEDIFIVGFLERGRFGTALKSVSNSNPMAVIPHEAITAAQSLKPYARSLSHELRTPMQGVVGMLDVMMATVQEAAEGQSDRNIRAVFDTLKENIEIVQDSSRRAVEAADNVVHAYDMDMGVPDSPISPPDDDDDLLLIGKPEKRPGIVVTGENVPITFKSQKRRRNSNEDTIMTAAKYRKISGSHRQSPLQSQCLPHNEEVSSQEEGVVSVSDPTAIPPGLRHTNLRDVLQFLVNDLLKVGGRPESAIAQEKEGGEEIEVRVRSPNGDEKIKIVRWTVHPEVPDTIQSESHLHSRLRLKMLTFDQSMNKAL